MVKVDSIVALLNGPEWLGFVKYFYSLNFD